MLFVGVFFLAGPAYGVKFEVTSPNSSVYFSCLSQPVALNLIITYAPGEMFPDGLAPTPGWPNDGNYNCKGMFDGNYTAGSPVTNYCGNSCIPQPGTTTTTVTVAQYNCTLDCTGGSSTTTTAVVATSVAPPVVTTITTTNVANCSSSTQAFNPQVSCVEGPQGTTTTNGALAANFGTETLSGVTITTSTAVATTTTTSTVQGTVTTSTSSSTVTATVAHTGAGGKIYWSQVLGVLLIIGGSFFIIRKGEPEG